MRFLVHNLRQITLEGLRGSQNQDDARRKAEVRSPTRGCEKLLAELSMKPGLVKSPHGGLRGGDMLYPLRCAQYSQITP